MASAPDDDPALPFLTHDLPGVGGRLKAEMEDFVVEELPAYEPCGEGDHLFLWIEKRDVAADRLIRHVARRLGVESRDIGAAGMKDRRGVTRQWLSVPRRGVEERLAELDGDGVRLLRSAPHRNKLKTGHLRGNRFNLLIRDVDPAAAPRAAAIADRLRRTGLANYYGEQRFGRDDDNVRDGLALLSGAATPNIWRHAERRFKLRLALSAVQSRLFNACLAERIRDGLFDTVLAGDVMQTGAGGLFLAAECSVEQVRFAAGETAITGPMFGVTMRAAEGAAGARESAALQAAGLTLDAFARYSAVAAGTRRAYRVLIPDLAASREADGLRLTFTLPSGSYATVLAAEFQKSPAPDG